MTIKYPFECACGERFKTLNSAIHCKKCRNYSISRSCHVVYCGDEIVYGAELTEEEEERHDAQNEKEARLMDAYFESLEKEQVEQEKAELEFKRVQELELKEDHQWAIQDRLSV